MTKPRNWLFQVLRSVPDERLYNTINQERYLGLLNGGLSDEIWPR
jgi:hypothetical protein